MFSSKYQECSSLFNCSFQSSIVTLFWLYQKLPSFLDILRSCLNRFIPESNPYFHHCQMYSTLGWIRLDDRRMFPWLQFSQKAPLECVLLLDYWLIILQLLNRLLLHFLPNIFQNSIWIRNLTQKIVDAVQFIHMTITWETERAHVLSISNECLHK